ncbi:MAG TPA: uroporphyrinogen decarboxylase family protein [Candidatus Paceibacterota bacterium]|nr:uroporphyrinogen decarboxylase family protein [Verrucomicrobiota bacterium]HRY47558.1 uroporphyrinogen decarboxylase family protein [Candidatus Paceibacterota bacterium]HSA02497.1 uroporphyrinogen decarboxylase family protein [Candidatus Paceibacterota bacterium]
MMTAAVTSLQRVLTALDHREPDRVPFFLLATLHGARELDLSVREYFDRPEHVVEGQLRLRAKYRHDCLSGFFYGPMDVEAWGGEVVFAEDGPPNSGSPFLKDAETIRILEVPKVRESRCLRKVLDALKMLKDKASGQAPILGVVISPFSLPVMQMGFESYLELLFNQPELFDHLMRLNEEFCVEWANAQLEAGATAICYFDPVSSPSIVPKALYLKTGNVIAKRTVARIKGPVAIHLASGRCLPILDCIAQSGMIAVGVSAAEDLGIVKAACDRKLAVMGNLNGIEMRRWTPLNAEAKVKEAITKAGPGGGFILTDNHGEIPPQVSEEILMAVSEAVHRWGRYPLDWMEGYGPE